ncbi:MAG: hypothetical protein WAK50_06550 [Nitrososphaeraceae archaeon]|jgi:hypothetical protein
MKQYLGGLTIGIIALVVIMETTTLTVQSSYAAGKRDTGGVPAVIATSDENVYVVWGNNSTTDNNTEIMFRASNDGGQSYADKINLSNSSSSNSTDFDIEATDNNVIVSWWETNATSVEPVIIFSNDHGTTFGPILRLASNGTISG